jgi:hypothetical protein
LKGLSYNNRTKRLALSGLFYLISALIATQDGMAASLKCVPVETGVWDCDQTSFELGLENCSISTSPTKHTTTWDTLASREEVYELLRKKYTDYGNAIEFAMWLNCEGFNVTLHSNFKNQLVTGFDINYFRKNIIPYYVAWYDPYFWVGLYDSEAFVVNVDDSGQIVKIETWFRN